MARLNANLASAFPRASVCAIERAWTSASVVLPLRLKVESIPQQASGLIVSADEPRR
jgi:hypothetical protein